MYSESSKKATIKYMKKNIKQVNVNFQKDDFEDRIRPAIEKTGMSISSYIKEAVNEKLEREKR